MTNEEIISALEYYNTDLLAVPDAAENERNFRVALKEVKERLEKYKWHNLCKNPEDLPDEAGEYLVFAPLYTQISADDFDHYPRYSVQPYLRFSNGLHWGGDIVQDEVWMWRYIEPMEEKSLEDRKNEKRNA